MKNLIITVIGPKAEINIAINGIKNDGRIL
jgi:hypothetical protein